MHRAYNDANIFAKILRGEIPNDTVYEDDYVLAFRDINPQKQIHALIIPKGRYTDLTNFCDRASDNEIIGLMRAVPKVIDALGVDEMGYRIISNIGEDGQQEVPHLHLHILGGEVVGPLVS